MKMYQSIMLAGVLLVTLMVMSFFLSKKSTLDINKTSPFECGFSNFTSSRITFSIHFFMIAIVFLMFDIEIALMLPMFISFKLMKINQWFMSSFMVTAIILYGLYHEWSNGVIEWSK